MPTATRRRAGATAQPPEREQTIENNCPPPTILDLMMVHKLGLSLPPRNPVDVGVDDLLEPRTKSLDKLNLSNKMLYVNQKVRSTQQRKWLERTKRLNNLEMIDFTNQQKREKMKYKKYLEELNSDRKASYVQLLNELDLLKEISKNLQSSPVTQTTSHQSRPAKLFRGRYNSISSEDQLTLQDYFLDFNRHHSSQILISLLRDTVSKSIEVNTRFPALYQQLSSLKAQERQPTVSLRWLNKSPSTKPDKISFTPKLQIKGSRASLHAVIMKLPDDSMADVIGPLEVDENYNERGQVIKPQMNSPEIGSRRGASKSVRFNTVHTSFFEPHHLKRHCRQPIVPDV